MAVSLWMVAATVIALLNVHTAMASEQFEATLHVKVTSLPDDVTQMEATDGIRYLLAVHQTSSDDVNCYIDQQTRATQYGPAQDVIEDDVTSQLVQSVMDDPQALSVKLGTDQEMDLFLLCLESPEDAVVILTELTTSTTPAEMVSSMTPAAPQRTKRRVRAKRGLSWLIYPGTKWCGAGRIAKNDTDLGTCRETDKCCRAHDKCDPKIPAWRRRYHMFNWKFWRVSHCKCDDAFKACLMNVNGESAASSVKGIFFDLLGIQCFTLNSQSEATIRRKKQ